jgi:S-DNA-T family DNA segregation ATPase FtsK/SpoIIIE
MANRAKKKANKQVRPTNETQRRLENFLSSSDFAKTRGVFDIIFSLFLFLSIISYFVAGGAMPNWCGGVGFFFANLLTKYTFGIASFGYCLLVFSRGMRLLEHPILPRAKVNYSTFFWMAWLSLTLGYVDHLVKNDDGVMEMYSGTFGTQLAQMLYGAIKIGLPVLLVFLAFSFLLLVHHVRVKLPQASTAETDDKPLAKVNAPSVQSTVIPKEEEISQDIANDDPPAPKPNKFRDFLLNIKEKAGQAMDEDKEAEKTDSGEQESAATTASVETAVTEESQPSCSATQTDDDKVNFTIDDEFERVNAKAKARADGDKTEGPTFTIIDNQPNAPTVVPPIGDTLTTTPASSNDGLIHHTIDEPYDPHLDLPHYEMPSTNILEDWERQNVKVSSEELMANKDKIVETLSNYGIGITDITASPGPTVTLYEIKPAPGIRISKIKSLEDDIALSLAALGIRIIAPIPGKGSVGIEVPNAKPQIVSMKTMLESDAFVSNTKYELPIAFGKTISNEPFVTDLAKMPHLLMAGATGTGKSVGLNAVIASLLYKKHPSELKFVMVDPKKVELSLYTRIERHYLAKLPDSEEGEAEPIITDVKRVVRTLNSLCIEMDNRYDLLKKAQVRKIKEYNDKIMRRQLVINEDDPKGHHYLPYIVLVIDEFSDLIMTAGKEIETPICRLAQLARAVGIHLIIATQRPTTNIITGTIKANFPARIAFRVTSAIDSRTILDCGGAQQLIGRGDMLISLSGSDLVRCQCALIETEEIEKLADFIGNQEGYSDDKIFTLPEYLDENDAPNKDFDPRAKDDFFNDAARLVVSSQFGSTSLLQRKLQLGYNRAGRIIDQLEAAGIVGPYNGSKAREVLIKSDDELEELLRSL